MPNEILNAGVLNQEILAFLRLDELDYTGAAAKFGKAALPFLSELINSNDENLATKAAYLAGYIDDTTVKDVLQKAITNKFTTVRIAAAHGAQRLDSASGQAVLDKALDDHDPGVVKIALKSAVQLKVDKNLKAKISKISTDFADGVVKAVAVDLLKKIN